MQMMTFLMKLIVISTTPTTSDNDPMRLQSKIQIVADKVVNWFSRNDMVVSGDKMLLLGTQRNQLTNITKANFEPSLTGDNKEIFSSTSEKLLGLVI